MAATLQPLSVDDSAPRSGTFASASSLLDAAARLWFATSLVGQWVFLYYIAGFYDVATLRGDFALWNKNTHLLKGYVVGDTAGNLAFAAHVLLAAIVTFGGALQLLSQSRTRFHLVHRWNGRLFLITAIIGAVTGLYMIWVRGARANLVAGVATSVDAALIITFALLAWRAARARVFTTHRRWALRAWIVASGVWFQRVGIFAWTTLDPSAIGMTKDFDGWFDLSWAFGCYLLPLAILETYLRAKDRGGPRRRYVMAAALFFLTVAMAFGIYAAYMFVWRHALYRVGA
jgi:hypothetical protein